jgi:antitoxin ParD1/3/4
MDTMNIALPESMKQFVQKRVTAGGYSSVSEYVRELIRADQKRKVEERIDALLLEGLDSGEPIPVTQEDWDEKKRKLTERLGKASASSTLSLGVDYVIMSGRRKPANLARVQVQT